MYIFVMSQLGLTSPIMSVGKIIDSVRAAHGDIPRDTLNGVRPLKAIAAVPSIVQ